MARLAGPDQIAAGCAGRVNAGSAKAARLTLAQCRTRPQLGARICRSFTAIHGSAAPGHREVFEVCNMALSVRPSFLR